MLRNLLANKKLLVVMVVVIVVVGIVLAVVGNHNFGKHEKEDLNIEMGKDKDDTQKVDDEKDGPYKGTGLEILDEDNGTVDGIDVSGDWDGKKNKTDDTPADDKNKTESGIHDKDNEGETDEDILIDDKVWGEPS